MKSLTEIEYYVTTTYKSLMWNKDPVYGGAVLLHPFRAALTETAAILALPTCTTPEIVLAGLEDEVQKVNDWTHTPAEYVDQIRARYQDIMNFIVEGTHTMRSIPTDEQKQRALDWLKVHAPRGTKIFSHITPHINGVSLVDVYVILQKHGELESVWLNRYMRHLSLVDLNSAEHILTNPAGNAQEMAERLGGAVWDDRGAYTFQQL